jgi:hypothetical protein
MGHLFKGECIASLSVDQRDGKHQRQWRARALVTGANHVGIEEKGAKLQKMFGIWWVLQTLWFWRPCRGAEAIG